MEPKIVTPDHSADTVSGSFNLSKDTIKETISVLSNLGPQSRSEILEKIILESKKALGDENPVCYEHEVLIALIASNLGVRQN